MHNSERRYDIDWLRVIAIGILIVYHIGIAFQPWGVFIGFIQNEKALTALWVPMSWINIWRIPLLFFVSGMGVSFALRKRNWKQLIGERSRRILVPLVFGSLTIVPLHILIWQNYYQQDLKFTVHPIHLWFLANIFIYVILLLPAVFYLKSKIGSSLQQRLEQLFSTPLGLLLIAGIMSIEALVFQPETYATFALNWHGFTMGFLAFFFGFILIYSGRTSWDTLVKWRWLTGLSALVLFIIRWLYFELEAPNFLIAIEASLWIFSVFGMARKYLNNSNKLLAYLTPAAYPVYILHMLFLYLGSRLIFPLNLNPWLKFMILFLFTFSVCLLVYEFIVKRIPFIGVLFGLNKQHKK